MSSSTVSSEFPSKSRGGGADQGERGWNVDPATLTDFPDRMVAPEVHHVGRDVATFARRSNTLLPALEDVERKIATLKVVIEANRPRPIEMPDDLPALHAATSTISWRRSTGGNR